MKSLATTPREVIGKTYLCISDIQILLGMSRDPARALFKKIKFKEKEKLGEYDVWPNMIQKDNLLKLLHISRENLMKDIELQENQQKKHP